MASSLHLTIPPSSHLLSQTPLSLSLSHTKMKLPKIIPKNIFKSKKSRSESDPSSFSTSSSSPTSVLPSRSAEISADEWSEISADVYLDLKQAFDLIGRDGDGKIRKEELEALLGGPPSREELRAMLDRDGDGCVTLEELYAIGSAFEPAACDAELRNTFGFFDTDRDGRITAEDLFSVFKTIGGAGCTLEECRRIIRAVDRNGDGFVCFEDFRLMMDPHLQS